MQPSRNIAARAGRWSARHRKTAVFGWLLFIVVAFMAGQNLGTKTLTQEQSGVGDSGQAAKIVKDSYPDRIDEAVLIQSKTLKTGDPQYRAVVSDVTKRLRETKGVHSITSPYGEGKQLAPVSDDGHSTMIGFEINGATEDAAPMKIVDATVADTKAAQRAHPDFNVEQFGSGSSEDAFMKIFSDDLQKATSTSLPITLILLVLAFGTLVAAGIPLLLAITGVLGTMGVVAALSQLSPVEETINHVILLIGLAVGVDYALFYLRRVREERAAGRSKEAAIEAAAATSGRAVLVSGFTVMIAMAGMYFAGAPTFTSFATGTIVVVAVAMLGSLTVLPALLSMLGDRTEKGRIPGLGRLRNRVARVGIWSRIVDRVLRRPAAVGRPGHGPARGDGDPGDRDGHRHPEHLGLAAAGPAGGADVQSRQEGVPVRDLVPDRRDPGQGRDLPGSEGRAGEVRARRRAAPAAASVRAGGNRREPGQDGRDR